MRVIAGTAKGTRLAPVPRGVRPVSDRAREGLFSSVAERIEGAAVLDLFAGTGALGIEALSRGAASAVFVERASRSVAAIRENLRRAHVAERAEVVQGPVERSVDRIGGRSFDLVFLDPPYAMPGEDLRAILERLRGSGALSENAIVLLTRDLRSSTGVIPVDWPVAKRLVYGDSVVTLLRNKPRTTEE